MQPLIIDPAVPFVLPDGPITIALVGCGGTGSHIAQSLARLAAHVRDTGGALDLLFIDGDRVEAKNVGRQLFCQAEVGQNKAQTLAARFGGAFGLKITALPFMATKELLSDVGPNVQGFGILVGAVDSWHGRQALHDALALRPGWRVWLDCGNHEHAGQVCLGSHVNAKDLRNAFALGGLCQALPAPSLQYPELLTPPVVQPVDCAAAMLDNAQSLMVNQAIASVAGQYLYQLVMQRRVTTMQTTIDLQSLSMRSTPITVANVAQITGVKDHTLRGERRVKHKGAVAV
jgi:PRTRC genetic system ThiF family protein